MNAAATGSDERLTCPACGASTRRRHPRFPRCRTCGELLIKCRYCNHFDMRIMDCTHEVLADRIHVSDPDLFTECPYHTYVPRRGAVVRPRTRFKSLALIGGVLIAGAVFFAIAYRAGRQPTSKIVVLATTTEQMTVGTTGQVRVTLLNRGRSVVRQISITLDRRFLSRFHYDFKLLSPPPRAIRALRAMWYLEFGGLRPDESVSIVLPITGEKPGTHRLRYQVFSEEGLHERGEAATTVLP